MLRVGKHHAWTFDCEGKTFLTFLDIFFVKQSGGSSMEPTGMDDNWLTMEARLRLRTKDHTWG